MKMMKEIANEVGEHANRNIEAWGMQDFMTLVVVATEELGETAKEVQTYNYDIDADRLELIRNEAKDFAAVGLQIMALVDEMKEEIDSDNRLKHCPYCYSPARLVDDKSEFHIECNDPECGIRTLSGTKEWVMDVWRERKVLAFYRV
jgi:hypothetical protein